MCLAQGHNTVTLVFGENNEDDNVLKFRTVFLFLFADKMMVIRAGTHKMLGSKAISADSDETLYLCHFICIFTVCQSTHLGVSSKQREG